MTPDAREDAPRVVHVDLDVCAGHGKCYLLASELFAPGDDDQSQAVYIGPPIGDSDQALLIQAGQAIHNCPEEALSWRPAPPREN